MTDILVAHDKRGVPHYLPLDVNRVSYERGYWPVEKWKTVSGRCGYDVGAGWNPHCCGLPEPCPKHKDERCDVCSKPALFTCVDASGQFVCGAPLCGKHGGNRKGLCRRHS